MSLRFSLRTHITTMMVLAVISDAILIPFYPQFFSARYGLDSAVHAGAYVAAISIAVMCALPLWARVARRVEPMHLLVYTQGAAGAFSLMSLAAPDVPSYWLLSMAMFVCKASYLLMYPYLMRFTPKEQHASTIGVLAVMAHFGAIFGAAVGGFVMQAWGPGTSIVAMAAGDLLQMAVCAYLIRSGQVVRVHGGEHAAAVEPPPSHFELRQHLPILRLALVMLVFDFSAYLIRPFFSLYWQGVTGVDSELLAGIAFAIPGMVAIAVLLWQARARRRTQPAPGRAALNLLLGVAGLLLHAAPHPALIVLGRVLYGWALFQTVVQLDVQLFRLSTPQRYAQDFSITNFFQNAGVLLSSFAAGLIVERYGLQLPFLLAAGGLALTALLQRWLLDTPETVAAAAAPVGELAAMEAPAHAR